MSVAYRVEVLPERHALAVTLDLDGPAAEGDVALQVPTWVPGDYDFEQFGRDVYALEASDPRTGTALSVRRRGWQGYEVTGATGAVRVRYTAAATSTDFSEECGIVGDTNAVLLGTRYLYAPADQGPCRVTYVLPDGWQLHHPSGATCAGGTTWDYPSHEVLVDTPVVVGTFDRFTRDVHGTPVHCVFLDRGVGFASRADAFTDGVAAVAGGYHAMFGAFPFADYTFVLALNPTADWGLEHLTSTMCGIGPDVFVDPQAWATGLRVCAHELFHAWNVRRLRPAPLDAVDFVAGDFTDGLWLAEGFTRYYEFLACTRTQVYRPAQFFSNVVNYFRHLSALPAYARVSGTDSSSATYLNHEKYPGRVNSAVDYYDLGMLVAFAADVRLRTATPPSSLDAAFASFYAAYAGRGSGYTTDDVREFFDGVLPGLGARLAYEATTPGAVDLVPCLESLGFAVEPETVRYAGLVLADGTGPAVYGVLDTAPAGVSGVAAEDVITAVEGYPFSLPALTWAVANQAEVTVDVLRGNQPRRYAVATGERTRIGALRWAGTPEQAARVAAWLGTTFAPSPGEEIPLDSYENFHGVETVI